MKLLLLIFMTLSTQLLSAKKISHNNMTFEWVFVGQDIQITLTAPTLGWVACGFNIKSGLKGTNLIMAAVKKGKVAIEDQFVSSPGNHQTILSLGGNNQIDKSSGSETSSQTTVRFHLNTSKTDSYHYKLEKGETYYLLLAYSREDDFDHHSMMRTEVKITL